MDDGQDDWERQIDEVWATAGDRSEDDVLAAISELAGQRPAEDPAAMYERASVLDFVGREAEAQPLYARALSAGLDARRHPRAVIQLASTLRNLGRAGEGLTMLEEEMATGVHEDGLDDALAAFLALALVDEGRPVEAAARALTALAGHLPEYGRAVQHYAGELLEP
ncbi:MAG: tetratricopeptide repeat protein [Pseudonocardiales bacterium]